MPDQMELWDVPMLAHVRGDRHRAWSATLMDGPPHLYEEHLGSLLAGASTSATPGTAADRTSVSTSGKVA
jgi:hypothetical protein